MPLRLRLFFKIFILIGIYFFAQGCSNTPIIESEDKWGTPLEKYLQAKKSYQSGNIDGEFSLEYLKSQAAQFLLSQGKTELKSANSVKAVQYLSQAREYNPWNDEIKDLYTLSIKFLVRSTKELSSAPCEIINNRLSLINSVSSDQISNFSDLIKKCNFQPNKIIQTNLDFKLSPQLAETEKRIFTNLSDEADAIIKRNTYIPKRELAYLALNYISNLEFHLGEPKISPFVSSHDKIAIKLPITVSLKRELDSKEYCEKTKELVWRQEFEDEILSPDYLKGNAGHMKCSYSFGGNMDIYTNPDWQDHFKFLYPLPNDAVFIITFIYKNGTKAEFKNVFQTSFRPDNVQYKSGFLLHFLKGDIQAKLRPRIVFNEDSDNYLELMTTHNNIVGLDKISFKLDLNQTFNYYMNNEYEGIEHIAVGN